MFQKVHTNVSCDHSRRIIGTTLGHPGTWNDKTIILLHELINKVQNGDVPDDHEFELLEKDKHGNIVVIPCKGAWFMLDNCYLA